MKPPRTSNPDRFKPQPNPTADAITKAVLQFLDAQGYAVWRQVNEGRWDPDRQQWYPHPNARRGVPDIIGFRRRDGLFIGVEVKAGADRLRDEQIQFLNELKAAGSLAFVAYSVEQFRASFKRRGLLQDPAADPNGAVPEPGTTAGSAAAEPNEPRATAELASTTGPSPRIITPNNETLISFFLNGDVRSNPFASR